MGGWTGNAGAPGPPPGGAAQGPPRLGRTPATTVAAPTGLHARPRPRRLCLCAAGPKEAAQQALASWGGALGDGGVERAAGLGRRALGHPVHLAPGTPLPPEVTPRLPAAAVLLAHLACPILLAALQIRAKRVNLALFRPLTYGPFFSISPGSSRGSFRGAACCAASCCLLLLLLPAA